VSVVVDTSVWVDYLRGDGSAELEALLDDGLVVLAPIVAAELLSAPVSRAERASLVDLLEHLPICPTPLAHWLGVGQLRAKLRRGGLTVSTPDAHVAQCALEAEDQLWSRDAVFAQIARQSELRLFVPRRARN
jgi:predicted nucleic acid-binding protein